MYKIPLRTIELPKNFGALSGHPDYFIQRRFGHHVQNVKILDRFIPRLLSPSSE